MMSAICHFNTLEEAVQTAQETIQYGVPIARIEMLNKDQMDISIITQNLKILKLYLHCFLNFMELRFLIRNQSKL